MNAPAIDRRWFVAPPHPAVQKLERIGELRAGWAFGEGRTFGEATFRGAEAILQQALRAGYLEIDVFPGRSGQIIVTIYLGNELFDFTVTGEGPQNVLLTHEVNGEDVEIEADGVAEYTMTVADAVSMLGGVSQWPSSESFTQKNTRVVRSALRAVPSSPQMTPEYRSSNVIVRSNSQASSALT